MSGVCVSLAKEVMSLIKLRLSLIALPGMHAVLSEFIIDGRT